MKTKRTYSIIRSLPILVVLALTAQLLLPFAVYAQDETPPVDPTPPVVEVSETPTATETLPEVAPTADPTPVVSEILEEVPQVTDLVVLDSGGEEVPLDVQDAAKIIAKVDPMWCPEGALPNDPGCTVNMTTEELIADMRANPDKYAANGVIYFDNTAPLTTSFELNDTEGSLGSAYSTLNPFNLTLAGGWNGGSTNTFDGSTVFEGPDAFLSIGSDVNPWLGSLTLNNLTFLNVTSPENPPVEIHADNTVTVNEVKVEGSGENQNGMEIDASDVNLTDVNVSHASLNGIAISASKPGEVTLNDVTAHGNGTLAGGLPAGSGVLLNGNETTLTVSGGTFSDNSLYGIEAVNSISTTIPLGNVWTDADDYAPGSVVTVSGGDNSLNGAILGFTPGEVVSVEVFGPNGYFATCNVNADAYGKWDCPVVLWAGPQAVGEYTYTANGLLSTTKVSGVFTDARAINWVTLNGGSSVTVKPGDTISVSINVTTSGTGTANDWLGTDWAVNTSSSGYACVNTPDHTSTGTYTETFNITAPSSEGTYNAYFRAYNNNGCSTGQSSTTMLPGGVITVKAATTTTITNAVALATDTMVGTSYQVDYTVTSAGGTPAGNVTVSDGSATCTATVAAGHCHLTSTTPGAKTITASYPGSTGFLASVSSGVPHNVYCSGSHNLTDVCGAPTNLNATGVSQTQINLTWTDNSNDEWWFYVERSNNGTSGWSTIGIAGADTPSYSDTSLSCEQTRYYRVRATLWFIFNSNYSNVASATTLACADTTPPVIAPHADVTEEATSAAGAIVNYTNPATSDNIDPPGTATCSPVSGSQFALGDTTVYCDATDSGGNHAVQTSFVVHVVDTTPPVIDAHGDVTVEATSALGAIVTYTSPATSDNVDPAGTATCAPASGGQFDLGDTTVYCDATDTHGNSAIQTSFVVHVVDTTPPVIAAHGDVTVEATSALGAIVTYTSPATTDIVDPPGTANCAPVSGSQFALGDTTVYCDATDTHGNAAIQTSFVVHVVDTTPPVTVITDGPNPLTISTTAYFDFVSTDAVGVDHEECKIDSGSWTLCSSGFGDGSVSLGQHRFYVRAYDGAGNLGNTAEYVWEVVETLFPNTGGPGPIIPVTGGQLVELSCQLANTLEILPNVKVTFSGVLCGYQASLDEIKADTPLPSPISGSFGRGLILHLFQGGPALPTLPGGTIATLSLKLPEGSGTPTLLFWDALANGGIGAWLELPTAVGPIQSGDTRLVTVSPVTVGGMFQIGVNFTGTFVLVTK